MTSNQMRTRQLTYLAQRATGSGIAIIMFTESDLIWMQHALTLARRAEQEGEVTVGAVLVKSVAEIFTMPTHYHRVSETGGLLASECGALLSTFFKARRRAVREEVMPQPQADAELQLRNGPVRAAFDGGAGWHRRSSANALYGLLWPRITLILCGPWRGTEVAIPAPTRNRLGLTPTWVRIPPSPPILARNYLNIKNIFPSAGSFVPHSVPHA